MSETDKITRIAAIGDLHVRAGDKGKWSDYFRDISKQADLLLIAGDLTDTGDEAEAHILSEELKSCNIPIVSVLGNHDHEKGRQKLIRQIVQNENVHMLDGESVVVKDIGIAGIKGFGGGFDSHMLSMFGEEPMKSFVKEAVNESLSLDRALNRLDQDYESIKKVVLMHYSPISATIMGEPEQIFPFLGCSRLAEPLTRVEIKAVFHGHAHRGILSAEINNGLKVYNVARSVLSKSGLQVLIVEI